MAGRPPGENRPHAERCAMLTKTAAKVKDEFSLIVAMPVKQSFIMSAIAVVFAIIALIVAVKR